MARIELSEFPGGGKQALHMVYGFAKSFRSKFVRGSNGKRFQIYRSKSFSHETLVINVLRNQHSKGK